MAHKQVLFRSEARERVLRGAAMLTDAVRVTLGPKSRSVLIQKHFGSPVVCNDGVTIAKEMDLEDPVENLGAHMCAPVAAFAARSSAVSVASLLLLTEATLTEVPGAEKEKVPALE